MNKDNFEHASEDTFIKCTKRVYLLLSEKPIVWHSKNELCKFSSQKLKTVEKVLVLMFYLGIIEKRDKIYTKGVNKSINHITTYYSLKEAKKEAYEECLDIVQQPYTVPVDFLIEQKLKELDK